MSSPIHDGTVFDSTAFQPITRHQLPSQKGANTFTAAHRHVRAAVARFQQSSNKEHSFPLPDRDRNASCLNETLADASLPSAKLSRVIDATADCMDARLGTKQALTSTQELNTWTVAAHAQAEEKTLGNTRSTHAQARRTVTTRRR